MEDFDFLSQGYASLSVLRRYAEVREYLITTR